MVPIPYCQIIWNAMLYICSCSHMMLQNQIIIRTTILKGNFIIEITINNTQGFKVHEITGVTSLYHLQRNFALKV